MSSKVKENGVLDGNQFCKVSYISSTNFPPECQKFCREIDDPKPFMGRFRSKTGKVFESSSKGKRKGNVSNSFPSTIDTKFDQIDCFVSAGQTPFVHLKTFTEPRSLKRKNKQVKLQLTFPFELGALGKLD